MACTSSISKFSKQGQLEEAVFPDIQTAWRKAGTMPSQTTVAKIKPGQPKDKIYALLGPPHFDEGFIGVREWDYIFTFRNMAENTDAVCQFKIIYDRAMLVQETFWKPDDCRQFAAESSPQMPVTEKIVTHEKETVVVSKLKVSSDGLFEFDKSALQDLKPGGKARLDKSLAEIIDKGDLVSIKVSGHTDRLGSDQYNLDLSQARATTIKDYLISQGIPAEKISAKGVGKATPVVECEQRERSAALIACLQPNRRFEIEVETLHRETIQQ